VTSFDENSFDSDTSSTSADLKAQVTAGGGSIKTYKGSFNIYKE
jgi:hypothetical protein